MEIETTEDESVYPPSSVGWLSVAIFTILYVLSYADRKILSLMIIPIQNDLKITDFQFGLLQGFAFSLLYALAGIPIGRLIDRYPRRIIMYMGVTFWSLATALSGFSQNFATLFVARMSIGVGEATLSPASYSMISDLFPKGKLSTALSVYGLGVSIGSSLAFLMGGSIITLVSAADAIHLGWFGTFHAWQLAFILVGLPGLLLAFLVFVIPEPRRIGLSAKEKPEPTRGALRKFMLERRTFLLCHFGGFSAIGLMAFSVSSWAPAFYGRQFGWSSLQIGIALAIYTGVFGTLGALVGGRTVDLLVRRGVENAHLHVVGWSVACAAPFGIAAFLVHSPMLSVALLCTMNFFLMFFTGPGIGALQLVTPNELRGQVSAIYLFVVSLVGLSVGPVAVGAITDFVFHDRAKVGWSVATLIGIGGTIAFLLLNLGRAPMLRALKATR
jgi:MFS family permease